MVHDYRLAWARNLWFKITEPRHLSVVYALFYGVAALAGLATLLVPPMTVEGVLGQFLAAWWALMLLVGGIQGIVTVLPGWWSGERWAVGLILGGLAVYGSVILSLHFTSPGSRLTQFGVLILAAGLFIVRWLLIRGRKYGPRTV